MISLKVRLKELKMFKALKVHLFKKFPYSKKNSKTILHFEIFLTIKTLAQNRNSKK